MNNDSIHKWTFSGVEMPYKKPKIRKKIAIDVDDTLADFAILMEETFGKPTNPNGTCLKELYAGVDYEWIYEDEKFTTSMEVVEGALQAVKKLNEKADIYYVSARRPVVSFITAEWLKAHGFPPAPVLCLGKDRKKQLIMSRFFDIIIDDLGTYLEVARKYNVDYYCHKRPWNMDRFNMTWEEICEHLMPRL